jgi:DnaA family protein
VAELDPNSANDPVQHQLSLAVRLRDEATFSNYLAQEPVLPLLDMLQHQTSPQGEAMVFICGAGGTGKSHLLQSCCQEQAGSALYLPLGDLHSHSPEEVLSGLEALDRVCIDDVHTVARDQGWELALFSMINRARDSGCRLVFAADAAPRALNIELADLQSRLGWGAVFQLPRLKDENKAAILRYRADQRGLSLSEGAAEYIVTRAPRGMDELLALLEQLDEASLTHKRALSIPFVKKALNW